MPRGYWGIFAAIAGLVLLSASPPEQPEADLTSTSSSQIEQAPENAATPLQQPIPPSQHDNPCKYGTDDRASDLCAQWKAADAAQSASYAAWIIGILAALIGAFTLAAAWKAAQWAKKAAVETEKGANAAISTVHATLEANRIAHAGQRAWVSLKIELGTVARLDPDGLEFDFDIIASNTGQSAAQNFELISDVLFHGQGEDGEAFTARIMDKLARWKADYNGPTQASLLPNDEEIDRFSECKPASELLWWDIADWAAKRTQPIVLAAVIYRVVGDLNTTHLSWRSWHLGTSTYGRKFSPFIRMSGAPIDPPDLQARPYFTTLMHEEYRAD